MIVVFVVDTSPSMGRPALSGGVGMELHGAGMSRLDLAKMAVEELSKLMRKSKADHIRHFRESPPHVQRSIWNLGQQPQQALQSNDASATDSFLLLSTSRQHPDTATCAAGGRLLVGFGSEMSSASTGESTSGGGWSQQQQQQQQHHDSRPNDGQQDPWHPLEHMESFQRELKSLKAAVWDPNDSQPFPEDAGGINGLNAALSAGLQLLSRYRLQHRSTENFGMGRLPNQAMSISAGTTGAGGSVSGGNSATAALLPACLVLVTDGACLRLPPNQGGGALQLQFGSQPLREFYKEPFRWDQRIFCLGVGGRSGEGNSTVTSTQFLHPQIRALCEVTGGAHWMVSAHRSQQLHAVAEAVLNRIRPTLPQELPIVPDPLMLKMGSTPVAPQMTSTLTISTATGMSFVNGGPVFCFQPIEPEESHQHGRPSQPIKARAMLLYTGSVSTTTLVGSSLGGTMSDQNPILSPPVWCIPEAFFPSKKLDSLPPRSAQPLLQFSKYPALNMGSKTFEPGSLIKMLHRLDQLMTANRTKQVQGANATSAQNQNTAKLHRDVYVCQWLQAEGTNPTRSQLQQHQQQIQATQHPFTSIRQELYCPVFVAGAGRPSLSPDESGSESYLNIGIMHFPNSQGAGSSNLSNSSRNSSIPWTTLTLLPPEPHILLPLLIRAAEAEHRALKKTEKQSNAASGAMGAAGGSVSSLLSKQQSSTSGSGPSGGAASIKAVVQLDDHWRSEFRAYLFRLPPYYQFALKRCLRPILPPSAHSLLHMENIESVALQCFSKVCLQKIRNGEQASRDYNERLERQEASLRRKHPPSESTVQQQQDKQGSVLRYGHFDARSSADSYLAALRSMPAPPGQRHVHLPTSQQASARQLIEEAYSQDGKSETASAANANTSQEEESNTQDSPRSVVDTLGDLPAQCLMAFYESRRRWIFGGTGLACRGLHVEGVNNGGSNSQRCGPSMNQGEECLLSLAGVGVSTLNKTTTAKMGDYRERLLFSRSPVVGYGSNDAAGVAATTAIDGSPCWSVDDNAMPMTFFDSKTGEFVDSVQARVRSRLFVNFGNPYKEKRADSLIPQKYMSQAPSMQQGGFGSIVGDARTPPGSPPHDSFDSVEEGEAIFVRTSPSRTSPKREEPDETPELPPPPKRQRSDSEEGGDISQASSAKDPDSKPAVPTKASALLQPPPKLSSTPIGGSTKHPPPPPPPPPVKKGPPPPPPRSKPSKPGGVRPLPAPSRSPQPKAPESGPTTQSKPAPQELDLEPIKTDKATVPPPPPKQLQSQGTKVPPSNEAKVPLPPPPKPKQLQRSLSASSAASTSSVSTDTAASPSTSASPPSSSTWHVATGVVAEAAPAPSAPLLSRAKSAPAPPPAPSTMDLQNPNVKPSVALPSNWMTVWSKSQKRWYFFDTKTNRSVWTWPPPPG